MPTAEERSVSARPAPTTAVAEKYVHRAAFSEVSLTEWDKVGQDAFTVTARWPRIHSFYDTGHGVHDPLLLCETFRQSGLLLAHSAYEIPSGHQVSWSRLQYAVNPQALRAENTPAEIGLYVTCTGIHYHRPPAASMTMRIEAVRDGSLLSVATIVFGLHSPPVYERLRSGRCDAARVFAGAPAPVPPVAEEMTGRTRPQDVVLSPTSEDWRWQLRVDTTHPVLFYHPVDHVPGMLLLEAVRQAAHALEPSTRATVPTAMDVSFRRYVEFDEPCWIEAETGPRETSGCRSVRVNAIQRGSIALTATAEMTTV
ncbi:ScbA/BarX family gamma-butyrolactone biosynthesis protein [Streptomyces sp. CNQ085]|uniref:ScbA/BarX family gamma-butyrolactone biosynthesis protein n=1 Tax=Streptomyces sp. CNQ085 TaxID=2886944 RepID=UPI001F50967A|nr:ScbA/BarX family gamma-butyrolactone biosynthesis protein [Streptomyces sp. CNQ085]MCI0383206.1 transcriptional regulator [Streptomyces sp. CNQ085]